ncbi:MAG: UvrB/UvrC motif-containing protein [Verrucomicrobiae bacterium]|nr:UvrB/UvrC motif-containing protein [Verrucomicrobiae bacterium]
MKCNVCNENEATVHLTQIVGEKMQKVDLCESCSKEKGVGDPTGFSLADMLLGLGASSELEEAGDGDAKCSACGYTHADFKKAGRFGCPECYQTFSDGLEQLLKPMHKGLRHVGKAPRGRKKFRGIEQKIKTLEKKLAKAVSNENYEQAAEFRDEIKGLREQLESTSRET